MAGATRRAGTRGAHQPRRHCTHGSRARCTAPLLRRTWAIFLDFCSLPQCGKHGEPRTPAEAALLERGLSRLADLYSHPCTWTLKLSELPELEVLRISNQAQVQVRVCFRNAQLEALRGKHGVQVMFEYTFPVDGSGQPPPKTASLRRATGRTASARSTKPRLRGFFLLDARHRSLL